MTPVELCRDVLANVESEVNMPSAVRWLNNRYSELVSRAKFRHLRQIGELSLEAKITTGTVSATQGSTTITGVSTTFQTEVGSGAQEYYFIKLSKRWYKIDSITNETSLELVSAFVDEDISGAAYTIVRRYYPLATSARWVGDILLTSTPSNPLIKVSLEELDIIAATRTLISSPIWGSQIGVDSNNALLFEFYPAASDVDLIRYVYWTLPAAIATTTTLPPVIDPYVLKEGLLIDVYRHEKSIELRKGNVEAAIVWRNEEKAQKAIWEKAIEDAVRTSRGVDDITFIINHFSRKATTGEQRTARDYVFDNFRY